MIAVKIENLTKTFGPVTAIDNMSLSLEKGMIVGLIGPDGAGKTTLLRLMTGLLAPTTGRILMDEIDPARTPSLLKEKIGYMPQHFSLYGDLTVSENLRFFAEIHGLSKKDFYEKRNKLLGFSGLQHFESRQAENLSGGMQKKLVLACNLLHAPDILLLDEPTTGVDPVSRRELWDLLFQLNAGGTTLIVTTPYMDEAQRCSSVGLIYEGRILRFAPPQALIQEMEGEVLEIMLENRKDIKNILGYPGLKAVYPYGEVFHLVLEEEKGGTLNIKEAFSSKGIRVVNVSQISPSMEDVFLNMITRQKQAAQEC